MELFLKQTVSGFSAEYVLFKQNQPISTAVINNNFTYGGSVRLKSFSDDCYYDLCYQPFAKEALKSSMPYNIYKDNQVVGKISCRAEGSFLKVYEYYILSLYGKDYCIYEVGLGKEGIKYPVYLNNQQVSLIEKDCVVYDNLDEYSIFSVDNEEIAFISYLAALYIDIMKYSNRAVDNKSSYEKYFVKTTLKELKEKYNPDFKSLL